jgi:hypothetical protein
VKVRGPITGAQVFLFVFVFAMWTGLIIGVIEHFSPELATRCLHWLFQGYILAFCLGVVILILGLILAVVASPFAGRRRD